jgi:hypothetical protein
MNENGLSGEGKEFWKVTVLFLIVILILYNNTELNLSSLPQSMEFMTLGMYKVSECLAKLFFWLD